MDDLSKTKPELIKELSVLRKRIQEFERSETERKRIEEELRLSRQQLRLFIDASPDFFFLKDLDLRYQLVNIANARFFGRYEADILGRTDFELMPEDSAAACRESDRQAIREKRIVITIETVEDRFYETYKFPVIVADKVVGVAGIVRDITERKHAEAKLRESEKQYKELIDGMNETTWVIDLNGDLIDVNRTAVEVFGYSKDELFTIGLYGIDSSLKKDEIKALVDAMPSDRLQVFETTHTTKEGRTFPVEVSSSLVTYQGKRAILSIARNITERKRAENGLKSSEEFLARLIASVPDLVARTDMNGKILYINDFSLELSGYDRSEVIGKNMIDFVAPEDHEKVMRNAMLMLEQKLGPMEYHLIMKDGRKLLFEANADVLRTETGVPYGMVFVVRDVTERKLLESQLLQSQKLEAVGTLAGGIAHDFNNILMGIQGFTSLMMMDLDTQHPHYERLRRIEEQVQSASDLTKQLLGFARGGRYEIRPTDMNRIIEKGSAMFGRTKKEITISGKYEKDLWTVEIDQSQIEQVLLNLYVNAGQAMSAGGELRLETSNVVIAENEAALHAALPGNYVRIAVADTGIGMDEEVRKRIFDPFFTTKGMGRGTGLGLAMVYGIIKGHSGFITVESEPGCGTTFTLYLPASKKKVFDMGSAKSENLRGSETILLVDDEPIVLEVDKDILEFLGYEVHGMGSGAEAVAFYREKKNDIDLVILDMVMPGLSGSETFDRIKECNPSVKVILSSGYSLNGEAQQIMNRGCQGFIQKPFNITLLSQKIREVLGK